MGGHYQGKPIISPQELFEKKYQTVIAIKNEKVLFEIKNTLKDKSVPFTDYHDVEKKIHNDIKDLISKRPLDINIETINFCPLKCVFCVNRKLIRPRKVMDNELFERIIREYCDELGGGALGIGSMQSDFLSDPVLLDRMKVLDKFKDKLWIYSTTPLISAAKYSDNELESILSKFKYLEISAEGYDEKSYKLMSGIDGFDVFSKQIDRLYSIIKRSKLDVDIYIAFRTNNEHDCENSSFYQGLKERFGYIYDVKTQFFSWLGNIEPEDLPEGARLLKKKNIGNMKNDCIIPNATLAVQADGRVVGCGCIDWMSSNVIGDTKTQSLKEIWTSREAIEFRKAFTKKKIPEMCLKCEFYRPDTEFWDLKLGNYNSLDGLYYYLQTK